jgi:hypothetical protein
MTPCPIALGLTLCDYVIVEEGTKKISLIGTFTGMAVSGFPTVAPPFSVFSVLTDAQGDVTMDLVVTRLDTGEEVYTYQGRLRFPDKFTEVSFHTRVHRCSFPAPGYYQVTLLAGGEWVAQRRLRVYQKGSSS